jgi:S-adenosylmethionine decarboxylase
MPAVTEPLATHILLDLHGVDPRLLDDVDALKAALFAAVSAAGATALRTVHHKFHPQGASVVILVAESHLSIHTWPEKAYAAVDIFTCGQTLARQGVQPLLDALKPQRHHVRELPRGLDEA